MATPDQSKNTDNSDAAQPEQGQEQADNGAGIRWLGVRDAGGALLYKYRQDSPLILQVPVKTRGKKRFVVVNHAKAVSGTR